MRLHVLGASEPTPYLPTIVLPVEDDPAGLVWQIQQPLIISSVAEEGRWPRFVVLKLDEVWSGWEHPKASVTNQPSSGRRCGTQTQAR